jgi:hypothetical protein
MAPGTADNPFYHRGAIRQAHEFHGREATLAELLGLLRNGQSISIIGPRRIGKSSLLLHLSRAAVRAPFGLAPPQALFVLIDCQELGGSPPEEVYEVLHTSLQAAAESADLPIESPGRPGTYRALDQMINRVSHAGSRIVVLLDEFELLAANDQLDPYFFARLRGLTTKYGLAYITASQRPLYAITADEKVLSSPFFNIFVSLSLGLFSEEEARQLLASRLRGSSLAFSPALTDTILRLVGTHPFFLHVAGYHAFQALKQGRSLEKGAGSADLDAAVEIEAASHLNYLWNNLTPDEQYALVATDGPVEIVRQLEQLCLLTRTEDGYYYTSRMLRRFVRRQHVSGVIQAGPFVIDPQRYEVKARGRLLNLTNSQFALLIRLAEHYDQVVTADLLESAVWGEALVDDPDRLKTLIKRLRRAIEPYGHWIVSERGIGYALRSPDE